jgi:hypothetical protein
MCGCRENHSGWMEAIPQVRKILEAMDDDRKERPVSEIMPEENPVPRSKRFVLSDDPVEALHQIGTFIDENMRIKGRLFPADVDRRKVEGCWQDIGFIYDLQMVGYYSKRYGSSSS